MGLITKVLIYLNLADPPEDPSKPRGRWCPEEEAGWLSTLLFAFANSLVRKGARKHLEQGDLWDTAHKDEPKALWAAFDSSLRATATPEAPMGRLWRALWRVHGRAFIGTGVLKVFHDVVMFSQPFILEQLLNQLGAAQPDWRITLGLSFALLGAALLEATTVNVYFNMLFRMSLHMKTELLDMLYRKSQRVSGAVKSSMGVGPIVNLQSNDAAKLWAMPSYGHMVWNGPFQVIVVMALLIRILTVWPALAGLLVTVAIIPMTMLLGKLLASTRRRAIAAADARVKLITEVITGIKAIKLYAWEEPYLERISDLREQELKAIRRTQLLGMINSSIFNVGPVLVSLAAFGVYAALGYPLTASVAFPSLALFNLLRFPIVMIPAQIMNFIAAAVGVARIQKFMNAEEAAGVERLPPAPLRRGIAGGGAGGEGPAREDSNGVSGGAAVAPAANGHSTGAGAKAGAEGGAGVGDKAPPAAPAAGGRMLTTLSGSPAAVEISNGTFAWAADSQPVLRDVLLQLPAGALVIAVGPVGSGKSSLLSAILGEMVALAPTALGGGKGGEEGEEGGFVRVPAPVAVAGSIAYTAQDPWIQNATLKNNVLMGLPMDEERYRMTIEACSLGMDLQMLPAGDESEIGEKGINLSGGQKHRVALARATYAAADVYLLDDPLSAVDAHVGRHLFDECICGAMAGKTRLLVTHQLQFLPRADLVLVVVDGRIAHAGTYQQLEAQSVDLAAFVPLKEEASPEEASGNPPVDGPEARDLAVAAAAAARSDGHLAAATGRLAAVQEDDIAVAGGGAEPLGGPPERSLQSVAQVVELPPHLTRSLLVGGSFASHTPHKFGDAARGDSGGGAGAPADVVLRVAGGDRPDEKQLQQKWQEEEDDWDKDEEDGDGKNGPGAEGAGDKAAEGQQGEDEKAGRRLRLGRLILLEHRAKGQVRRSVYLAYLGAWGPLFLLPTVILIAAMGERVLQVLQNFVLSLWSNFTAAQQRAAAAGAALSDAAGHSTTSYYLMLYFVLGLSSVVIVLARSALLVVGSIAASRKLHKSLLAKMLRLPMSFFDSQPTGRLINRFTKDTEAVDTQMAMAVNSALACLVGVVVSVVSVAVVSPYTLVVMVPLGLLYYRVQHLYISTSRELKRLDAIAFSPIFHHYGESLAGIATIRAFGRQELFAEVNREHIEQSNRAWWPIQLLNRWLSMRLEITGACVVFFSAVAVGVISPRNAGLAGFALTSALNLTGTLAWMVRQTTELEVNMNSVERMIEYEGEKEEAPAIVAPRPPPEWPPAGAIVADRLSVRYRPGLPRVLKGVSFAVNAREKIGICGRTGCGKSTLMMVLFRMVEPCGGCILIDGIDTATLGLSDLRSRLSLVPQDPVIFSGTVRSNLDPFGQAGSDMAIWEALRRAGVDGMVKGLGSGLDSHIQEAGNNLSSGQRQLLCMARALLRSSRILVLDEATSNVDQSSDALVQRAIRGAFAECTVLTIAHRLHTIVDADRVMVLDAGRLREFGAPAELMGLEGGAFRGLVEEASRHHGPPSAGSQQADDDAAAS